MRNTLAKILVCVSAVTAFVTPSRFSSAGAEPPTVCIPPLVETEAACAFDVWGHVFDQNGEPFADVFMSDGQKVLTTGAGGFYDFYELMPGSYDIVAQYLPQVDQCSEIGVAMWTIVGALTEGGARLDFHLDCTPN